MRISCAFLLLLLPSFVFAQGIVPPSSSGGGINLAAAVDSTVASGNRAFSLLQGAQLSFNGVLSTKYLSSDGTSLNLVGLSFVDTLTSGTPTIKAIDTVDTTAIPLLIAQSDLGAVTLQSFGSTAAGNPSAGKIRASLGLSGGLILAASSTSNGIIMQVNNGSNVDTTGFTLSPTSLAAVFNGAVSASNLTGTNSGDVTIASPGGSSNANGATISTQALSLTPADGTNPGMVTTSAQTIAGVKTFTSAVTLGASGPTLTNSSGTILASGQFQATHFLDTSAQVRLNGNATETVSTIPAVEVMNGVTDQANGTIAAVGTTTAISTNNNTMMLLGACYSMTGSVPGTCPWKVQANGRMIVDSTDASGSPGAATINKPAGKVAIAASASSVVVTDSAVSSTSIIFSVMQTSDAVCTGIKSVVPGSGTFTINASATCTGATTVGFLVIN